MKIWLKENEQDYVNIPGYKFVGQDRPNRKGGGVGVLIKNNITSRIVTELCKRELSLSIAICVYQKLAQGSNNMESTPYKYCSCQNR